MFAAITPVLLFIAFILLLLVTLSAPIIKSIFLFRLTANAGSTASTNFGVWGYCISSIDVSISYHGTTTAALVLHPIAAGLTFLAFLISLFILRRGSNGTSRLPSFCTLGVGLLAAVLTTSVVRHRVRDASDGDLQLNWGNAVWMTLGATIALWLAMVGACAGVCACGGRRFVMKAICF
ncbi:pali-domain-containing protein [Lyophyllum atratum]|nr:pali-domain-containing protein [Lyophyllum atratum]